VRNLAFCCASVGLVRPGAARITNPAPGLRPGAV
jgi:hypothetical protein